MTQEQKQIKLAEVQGILSHDKHGPLFHTKTGYVRDCPDYFNDLNAVHDLRAKLTDRQKEVFSHYLAYFELPDEGYIGYIELPPIEVFNIINASAEVQSEALGKTLNLW